MRRKKQEQENLKMLEKENEKEMFELKKKTLKELIAPSGKMQQI